MNPYQSHIQRITPAHRWIEPRHVEAKMRMETETGCLDHLSPDQFDRLALRCFAQLDQLGKRIGCTFAERLAASLGL